jgi:hypothetical protein
MKIVQQMEAQLLFDAGTLKSATVIDAPFGEEGCNLMLEGKNKMQYFIASARHPDSARSFKTFDGAIKMARRLGFKKVEVVAA